MSDDRGWETGPVLETHVYVNFDDETVSTTAIPVNSIITDVDVQALVEFNSDDVNELSLDWAGGEGHTGNIATVADLAVEGAAAVTFDPWFVQFAPPGTEIVVSATLNFGAPTGGLPSQGRALIVVRYVHAEP
jgi:hypothetical protein